MSSDLCLLLACGDSLCYGQTNSQRNCEVQYVGQSNTCAEDEQVVAEYIKLSQSPEDQKGPVLVIHQPLFHVSPLAKGQLLAEALSKCKGQVTVQAKAQLEMLAARPGSLVIQLDSSPIGGPWTQNGVDATQVYRDVYSSAQHNTSRLLYLTSAFTTGFSHLMISATTSDSLPPVSTLLLYFYYCTCAYKIQLNWLAIMYVFVVGSHLVSTKLSYLNCSSSKNGPK
jgi:hypothetical protein